MSPERIKAWLNRIPEGAERIQLVFVQLGTAEVVGTWGKGELMHSDPGGIISDTAQQHCDDLGSPARYTLQYVGAEHRVLSSMVLRFRPSDDAEPDIPDSGPRTEDATLAGIVTQMMRHSEVRERTTHAFITGMFGKMQTMLTMQDNRIKDQAAIIDELVSRLRSIEIDGATEESSEESAAKAEAYRKVGNAVAEYVVPLLAARMGNGHDA